MLIYETEKIIIKFTINLNYYFYVYINFQF